MTSIQNTSQRSIEWCNICHDYLTEVRETPCCHNLFCLTCIQTWLDQNKSCPDCRSTSLTEHTLLTNVVIQRVVDNLLLDCPYKLQGCPAKVPRCDLTKHKQSCPYSLEKLANKQQQKLTELKTLLSKYINTKSRASDNALYDLAKLFHEQHAYTEARQCFEMMTTKNSSSEMVILQAQIERDDGQYNKALRLYDQAHSTATPVPQRIDLLLAKGHMFVKMAKYIEAKDAFTHALDILPNDNQSQTQKKAEILNSIGLVAKKCSDYDQAISVYNQALGLVDTNSDLWAEIVSNLADIHRKKGDYKESHELYLQALKQMESFYGQDHPSIADIMNNLGMLLKKEGKYNEALEYYKQALKICKHYHGEQHSSIGIYLTNMGDIYRKQSDFKMAEVLYKRALTILEKSFGSNHIEVAEVLNSIGLVLKKRADYDGAEACYKQAILIVHNTFGNDQEHYKLGIYYNNLADLDRKRTKFDDALRLYQRALTAIEKTLGLQHSEAAEILHNIGQVQHQLGNFKEAIDRINQALMIIKKEFGDTHYKYGMFLNSLGLAYAMINDYKSAYVHSKQALQILLSSLGQDHIEVCDVYSNLGDCCMKIVAEMGNGARNQYEKMLKLEEAKKFYTEAERIVQATFGVEHTKAKQFLSLLYIIDNYDSL